MVALDTNVVIDLLNDKLGQPAWLTGPLPLCLPTPVVGELLFGARNSGKTDYNLNRYRRFFFDLPLLPLNELAAEYYAEIRLALKQKGRPIPENDMWIAAICRAHDVLLLTFDQHFAEVAGLHLVPL